jgi:hypothetical protein
MDPRTYQLRSGQTETISYLEVIEALAHNEGKSRTEKEAYIREGFDWFFFRIDRIEHYVRRELIDFNDVKDIFKVYAHEMAKKRDVYDSFLGYHGYDLARSFFARYSEDFRKK